MIATKKMAEEDQDEVKKKIEWLLEKKNIAQNRADSLENAAKNLNKFPQAKTAVGGQSGGSNTKSDQERFLDEKEELEELAQQLRYNAEYVEKIVSRLPQNKRVVIEGKYFHELKNCVIKNRTEPQVSKRQVSRIKKKAIDDLVESRILVVYDPIKNLLENT